VGKWEGGWLGGWVTCWLIVWSVGCLSNWLFGFLLAYLLTCLLACLLGGCLVGGGCYLFKSCKSYAVHSDFFGWFCLPGCFSCQMLFVRYIVQVSLICNVTRSDHSLE